MPQGRREKQPKNLSVLFLDRSPGPWYRWALEWRQDSDLENSSGFRGPRSAPLQETWHEPVGTKIRKEAVMAFFFVIKLYSWQLSADTWPPELHTPLLEKGWALANTYLGNELVEYWHLWRCDPETQTLDILLVCCMPDCHVHQHPPPTNGLIWPPPPPPMVAATSLMPNRPARGLLSEGEGAHAWIPQSNLNM